MIPTLGEAAVMVGQSVELSIVAKATAIVVAGLVAARLASRRACVGPPPPSGGHVRGTRRAPAPAGRRTASHHRRTGRPHARDHPSGGGCASGVRRATRCR
jgi:hypothetical protein